MSTLDRNRAYNKKAHDLLMIGDEKDLAKHIETIRSKTLKDLCLFNLYYLDDPMFMVKYSPKELSKIMRVSERKIYDLIKVSCFVSNSFDVGFKKEGVLK